QPNTAMIDTIGMPQAQVRMRETLLRSVNPAIQSVDITEDFLRYRLNVAIYEFQLFFGNVSRVEIYDNNFVFIRGHGDQIMAQIFFATAEEAKTFADLLMSFRDNYLRSKRS